MIKALRHSGIVVSDIQLMTKFYQDIIGLSVISDEIEEGAFIESIVGLLNARIHVVKMKHYSGFMVELLKYLNPKSDIDSAKLQPSNKLGHSHLALTVTDINGFLIKCKTFNVLPVNPPQVNTNNTVIVCYMHDPEGNLLELVEVLEK